MVANNSFESKVDKIKEFMKQPGDFVKKDSNHLYGLSKLNKRKLDLSCFREIIDIHENEVELESGVTINELLTYLISKDYILPVVPDLGHLTIGGIISGVGGGSATFKNGFFHEIITEMTVIMKNGFVVTCSDTQNRDIFYSIPNSLGTLGYILKLKIKIIPLKEKFVSTKNIKFDTFGSFFEAIKYFMDDEKIDFMDGTIFSEDSFVLVIGKLIEYDGSTIENFINNKIYWQSIQQDESHTFTILDYIYRWDTDLYYTTSRIPGFLGNFLRKTWWRPYVPQFMLPLIKRIAPLVISDGTVKDIMNDILIPFSEAEEFWNWVKDEAPVYPIYICPAVTTKDFKFWNQKEPQLDFGFGYGIDCDNSIKIATSIEKKMLELGGRKLLYTKTNLSKEEFGKMYSLTEYESLWKLYSNGGLTVYDKVKRS